MKSTVTLVLFFFKSWYICRSLDGSPSPFVYHFVYYCLSALAFPLEIASDSAYSCLVATPESLFSSRRSLHNSFTSLTSPTPVLFLVPELPWFNILELYSSKIYITSIYPCICLSKFAFLNIQYLPKTIALFVIILAHLFPWFTPVLLYYTEHS